MNQITGYSGTFGKRAPGHLDRFTNQTAQWRTKGPVTKVVGYYSSAAKCIQGLKVSYGYGAADARLLGQEAGLSLYTLILGADEKVNKVQIKADT